MDQTKFSVSIVIPNWNGKELLQKYLPSVLEAAKGNEVIVVDDGSTDGSVETLQSDFPGVRLIRQKHQRGFSHTVNTGVREATGDIVVLLNTDIKPEKDFLTYLVRHFENPEVFAVGCMDKSVEGTSIVLRGVGVARWIRGFYIHKKGEVNSRDTAWVSGGSGAFRRSLWNTLGGLDELYSPFYWEDIDLSYRARKSGYVVRFEPKSIVWHYHEQGKILRKYSKRYIRTISYRNQFIFIWKNLTDPGIMLEHALWLPVRLMQAIFRGHGEMVVGYILALLKLSVVTVHRIRQLPLYHRSDRELE